MRTVVTLLASLALAHGGELHQAARVCDADRMRQLLARNPPLNATDETGMTPLHIAIDARQTACVGLLLEAGADRKVVDRQGRTALDAVFAIADLQARGAMTLLLVRSGQKASQEATGPAPWSLEYAVAHRQTDVVKMMLSMGADPNAPGQGGVAPLADAALKGYLDGVRLLLARGARTNVISRAGTQPIHDAALGGNAEVIRELASHGADVNARTRDEAQTPLHIAAAMGRVSAVEALIGLGADVNCKDAQMRTPLDDAERAGLSEAAAILKGTAAAK